MLTTMTRVRTKPASLVNDTAQPVSAKSTLRPRRHRVVRQIRSTPTSADALLRWRLSSASSSGGVSTKDILPATPLWETTSPLSRVRRAAHPTRQPTISTKNSSPSSSKTPTASRTGCTTASCRPTRPGSGHGRSQGQDRGRGHGHDHGRRRYRRRHHRPPWQNWHSRLATSTAVALPTPA